MGPLVSFVPPTSQRPLLALAWTLVVFCAFVLPASASQEHFSVGIGDHMVLPSLLDTTDFRRVESIHRTINSTAWRSPILPGLERWKHPISEQSSLVPEHSFMDLHLLALMVLKATRRVGRSLMVVPSDADVSDMMLLKFPTELRYLTRDTIMIDRLLNDMKYMAGNMVHAYVDLWKELGIVEIEFKKKLYFMDLHLLSLMVQKATRRVGRSLTVVPSDADVSNMMLVKLPTELRYLTRDTKMIERLLNDMKHMAGNMVRAYVDLWKELGIVEIALKKKLSWTQTAVESINKCFEFCRNNPDEALLVYLCVQVFCLWQISTFLAPGMRTFLEVCFRNNIFNCRRTFGLSIFLSKVSHKDIAHLLANMAVLVGHGPIVRQILLSSKNKMLEKGDLQGGEWKLSSAWWRLVFESAMFSAIFSLIGTPTIPCLGLSGVLSTLSAITFLAYPEKLFNCRFMTLFPVEVNGKRLLQFMLVESIIGCLFNVSLIPVLLLSKIRVGHWAHLGGLLFGMKYYEVDILGNSQNKAFQNIVAFLLS